MFYELEDYENAVELETHMILTELPYNFIKESIEVQINELGSNSINYLNTITDKIKYHKRDNSYNTEMIETLDNTLLDISMFVINKIKEKLDIDISVNLDTTPVDDILEIAESLYCVFILDIKSNISRFFYKYIQKNKKYILDNIIEAGRKKDVTIINMKKILKSKDDATIAANIPKILSFIKDVTIDNQEFIKYASDESFEFEHVKQMIDKYIILGDITPSLFELLDDSELYDYLYSDLMYKFVK